METKTIDMTSREIWEKTKNIFISTLGTEEEKSQSQRCFSMITSVVSDGNTFTVMTSSSFSADLLEKDYSDRLRRCLELASGKDNLKLAFKHDTAKKQTVIVLPEKGKTGRISNFISTMPLSPDYTFEEFVVGGENNWAHAAAKGAAKEPGKKGYNPLFIHGGTGLGKTHIMQAIGNEVKKNNPMAAVCYITAEVFLNEYVNALSSGNIGQFRDRYRNIDVLLIDDIQFLQKNMQNFQEEFFNTFNTLFTNGKQIVMTSDVAPRDLPGIEARLISRFQWGMVQEIEKPHYETRLAILKKKAESSEVNIEPATLEYIAHHITSHVRAMEGALGKVVVMKQIDPSIIMSEEVLAHLLKDFIEKENTQKNITIEEILNEVANKYGITIPQMMAVDRTASIVTPRQLAMYIARKYTTKSLPEIARIFDKNHSTIIHGVKNITKRIDVEPDLKKSLVDIISKFGYSIDDKVG